MNGAPAPHELWLKSTANLGPWPASPPDQHIADILLKHVWSGYATGQQIQFEWATIDRPQGEQQIPVRVGRPSAARVGPNHQTCC